MVDRMLASEAPGVFIACVASHGQIWLDDFCVKYVFLESWDSPKPLDSVTHTCVILMVFRAPDVEKTYPLVN